MMVSPLDPSAPTRGSSDKSQPLAVREEFQQELQETDQVQAIQDESDRVSSPFHERLPSSLTPSVTISKAPSSAQHLPDNGAIDEADSRDLTSRISHWADKGQWPHASRDTMPHYRIRKASSRSLRGNTANSDSRLQGDSFYADSLESKNVYMYPSKLGIAAESIQLCQDLLSGVQNLPQQTIFDDDVFDEFMGTFSSANEARVVREISRLLVPTAETLSFFNNALEILKDSIHEAWDCSIPLISGHRPQPDYSVGFRRRAFSMDRLDKLSKLVGDPLDGDTSYFMGTHTLYFPFLTCEVEGSDQPVCAADLQNAHSAGLAVRGVVELFRLAGRENEIDRQILAFSVSHDQEAVRIYGWYAALSEGEPQIHRHWILSYFFQDPTRDRWEAYRFTMNLYERWAPEHLSRLCSAIDDLPADLPED